MTTMNIFDRIWKAGHLRGHIDTTERGHGNRAARRAMRTKAGVDHLTYVGEEIYTERNPVLVHGTMLMLADRCPSARKCS